MSFFIFREKGGELIELFGVSAVSAPPSTVEFRRTWRQYEQMQAASLAGQFEVGGELRAAVNLQGANGKRHAVLQRGTRNSVR